MKFPIVLRSTHEFEVGTLRDEINLLKDDYMTLNDELYNVNQIATSLENRNCHLSVKLTTSEIRANKYEDWYNNLTCIYRDGQNELNDKTRELQAAQREIERYKKKVDAFEKLCSEYKEKNEKLLKDVDMLGKVYNNMNRKLWANHEAQRQIRKLSVEILDYDKINKSSLSKYLQDLGMLIGGGEEFVFVGMDEAIANVDAQTNRSNYERYI